MKNKIFIYSITFGLITCLIGFLLIKTAIINQNFNNIFVKTYWITVLIAVVLIIKSSTFLKNKFNLIYKFFIIIFVSVFAINLLKEFEFIDFQSIEFIIYLLNGSLIGIYIFYFIKKEKKNWLDIFKVIFVFTIYIGCSFNFFNYTFLNYKFISNGLFWTIVVLVMKKTEKMSRLNEIS